MISIIIPVYNNEKYIAECIDSVVKQTIRNIQIILVDDGSTDDSGRICQDYADNDDRITYIKKQNGGVSSARNEGLKYAKYQYITFIDSDDWVEETYCEKLLGYMQSGDYDLVVLGLTETNGKYKKVIKNRLEAGIYTHEKLSKIIIDDGTYSGITIHSPCDVLYKKEIIEGNNIRFNENVIGNEDGLFNIEYFFSCSGNVFINFEESYYNYRVNELSASHEADRLGDSYISSMNVIEDTLISLANRNNVSNLIIPQLKKRVVTLGIDRILYLIRIRDFHRIYDILDDEEFKDCLKYIDKSILPIKKRIFFSIIRLLCR